jgi:hypothetical protein
METEQWLEEAMLMTNRSLRLIPDGYLRETIKSCRKQGITLESVASAGSQVRLIDEERISEFKDKIPEPSNTRPRPDDLRAIRKTLRVEIDSCRFWINCVIGATREFPVIFDLQPTDEKDDENIRRIMGDMADRIMQDEKQSNEGDEDGNRHNHTS